MKPQNHLPLISIAILTIALFFPTHSVAQASDAGFFGAIAGNWTGTLEYKDYSSGERVALSTRVRITASADGQSAEISFAYDDYGKVIRSKETRRIDAAAGKFYDGDFAYTIDSMTTGRIVVLGNGRDGNTVERIRETITFDTDSLTILKETRDPWQFRNVLKLKRVTDPLPEITLSAENARADLAVLQRTLETIHPGVFRYITPAELRAEFDSAASKISGPVRESELLLTVAHLLSKLKCGHTHVNPYNQDDDLRRRVFDRRNYLPFFFTIIDGRFFVTANASSKRLPIGSEILSINGVKVKEIVEKLLSVTTADGNSTMGNRVNSIALDRENAELYALFDWYFPLFFPLKEDVFEIEAIDFASKKDAKFAVFAMTKSERTAEMVKRYGPTPSYDDGWKFEIRDGRVGYLKISNSITWKLEKIKFRDFIANAFAELRAKKIPNLIIDLRGNGGGDTDIGFELARHLTAKTLPPYIRSRRLVRNVAPQSELAKFLKTYSPELKAAIEKGVPAEMYRDAGNGFFEIIGFEEYPNVEPYPEPFEGKAFIIADASNASASFQFLNYVKQNRLATIVGQTTGGNRQGINGGDFLFLSLPNSKIETDVPVFFSSPLSPQPDSGVVPDIPVVREPDDVGNGFDREFETIMKLVDSRR